MDSKLMSILDLPVELSCAVLDFLAVPDLLRCNLVCRRLRRIVFDSSALQYKIELSRCRMKPISSVAEPSFSSRLKLLRDRESKWRTLNPMSRNKLKLAHSGTVYEFSGGLYGTGKETDRRTGLITFYDLPSVECGQQRNRTYFYPDIHIVDFTMDVSQDLLILVVINQDSPFMYDLHFRTLSSNEPHPGASSPILPCYKKQAGLDSAQSTVRIQISGDMVGFLIKEEPMSLLGHFEAFKWRAPRPNSCTINDFSGIDDFTFLSEDHFLLVRPNGMFEVYRFSNPISETPTLTACYTLPTLSDAYCFWYISLSSNPSPGYTPQFQGENKTYHCSPSERLHACSIYVVQPAFTDRDTVYPFVFFFHPKTFLNPPSEWQESPESVDPSSPFSWPNSTLSAPEASTFSSSASFQSGPNPAPRSSRSSSSPPHSRTPSSTSSVFLDGSSQSIVNFPAPQVADTGPSSMLFDMSPSSSSATTPSLSSPYREPILPIPWEAWGPSNTRWFRDYLSKDWQRSIYGLRVVDCVLDRTAPEDIMHRNDRAASKDEDEDEDEDGDEESSMEDGLIFINDVAVSAGDIESHMGLSGTLPKFLRLRDFNPYSIALATDELAMDSPMEHSPSPPSSVYSSPSSSSNDANEIRDMMRDRGGYRRVVTTPSKTNARGVFRKNIISCLPYVEVISEDVFNVNEVMMDDCRLLLVKRGRGRKLKSIDILSM
ncbi:hypothetical protein D9757_004154 [Collybiopsis confluens]|uniref:F-box domain-containing protein n=1 Tax=Collybiopsis confluens TaxID=2823264 RepID=A0A8H5MD89_9AGAR|nr:hypothetical protein D9757_004154 [Collybiopsis confluens]